MDERYNQTLQTMLSKMCVERKDCWDEFIDSCVYAYNTATQESTTFPPFDVMFGRKALLPFEVNLDKKKPTDIVGDIENDNVSFTENVQLLGEKRLSIVQKARERILRAQEKQKKNYDRKHAIPNSYRVGDKVLKKNFSRKKKAGGKLDSRFTGPYVILKVLRKGRYLLRKVTDPAQSRVEVYGGHIKLCKSSRKGLSSTECSLSISSQLSNSASILESASPSQSRHSVSDSFRISIPNAEDVSLTQSDHTIISSVNPSTPNREDTSLPQSDHTRISSVNISTPNPEDAALPQSDHTRISSVNISTPNPEDAALPQSDYTIMSSVNKLTLDLENGHPHSQNTCTKERITIESLIPL